MKRGLSSIAASAMVMLGLPWLAVTFAPGDAGMAICFLLFYVLDPIYAIDIGIRAGEDIRKRWYLPALTAVLFLMGSWLLFDPQETVFVQYALIYLILGSAAMIITPFFHQKKS